MTDPIPDSAAPRGSNVPAAGAPELVTPSPLTSAAHSSLAPVFAGLRWGLHALLLGLAVFTVVRAYLVESRVAPWVLVTAIVFVALYFAGAFAARRGTRDGARPGSRRGPVAAWIVVLTLVWAVLVWLSPEAAYLVFPLFFLYLHVLPGRGGVAVIVVATAFAILALGLHQGFSAGGVVGPLVGAGIALLIGLAYRALNREAKEREALLAELIATREQLARTEREQGALAERARLARDLHDTVAQGLASIQMLLRAAERDVSAGAGLEYLRLARETAADSLAETRQIIGALTPSRLDDGLAAALRRLGAEQSARTGVPVAVRAAELGLPMATQTALLRIAQGALSNALRHADARRIELVLDPVEPVAELAALAVRLTIHDDGRGFDASAVPTPATGVGRGEDGASSHSFGLAAMRQRVEQLGGELRIDSAPGRGTTVTATLQVGAAAPTASAPQGPASHPGNRS